MNPTNTSHLVILVENWPTIIFLISISLYSIFDVFIYLPLFGVFKFIVDVLTLNYFDLGQIIKLN